MSRVGLSVAVALTLSGCNWFKGKQAEAPPQVTTAERLANQRRLQRICASNSTYDRLKVALFDKAAQVRGGRADVLDQLQAATIVRMESPVVKGRNDALNVTVCTGRFVLELPEGAARAFNGERRLLADIEYSAQPAVDNTGMVYQMQGADPIVYRLAALGIANRTARAEPQPPGPLPVPSMPAPPSPAAFPPLPPELRSEPPSEPPLVATRVPTAPRAPEPRVVIARAPLPPRRSVEATGPAGVPERPVVVQRPPRVREVEPQVRPPVRTVRSQPSFTCANARARVENMVCSSDRLAAADRAMSATFFNAIANSDRQTQAELRASRTRFLRFRNACATEACVAQAYSDRIDEIEDIAGGL